MVNNAVDTFLQISIEKNMIKGENDLKISFVRDKIVRKMVLKRIYHFLMVTENKSSQW